MQTANGTFDSVSGLTFNVYIAPATSPAGTCHVKVTSATNPANSATSAITVTATAGQFTLSATSTNPHGQDFTVTDLENGTILILGGDNAGGVNELYNASTKTFSSVPSMLTPRYQHTAVLLHKGINAGRVLVCGGLDAGNNVLSSCELYDIASNTFIAGSSLSVPRRNAAASELPTSGDVLISGGNGTPGQPSDLYNSTSGAIGAGCAMTAVRFSHTSTLLPGDKLLLAGGGSTTALSSAEIYNHATNTCSATATNMSVPRLGHAAVALPSGKVLLGGTSQQFTTSPILDIFDPATSSFSRTGDLQLDRCCFQMNAISGGRVLISGGLTTAGEVQIFSELYDSSTGTTTATDYLHQHRFFHKAVTVLLDGTVIQIGGHGNAGQSTQPVDLYTPGP